MEKRKKQKAVLIAGILFILVAACGLAYAVSRGKRGKEEVQLTEDDISLYGENGTQREKVYFAEGKMLLWSRNFLTEWKTDKKITGITMEITDRSNETVLYHPLREEGKGGKIETIWRINQIPAGGNLRIIYESKHKRYVYQSKFLGEIPNLLAQFREALELFNEELRMENLYGDPKPSGKVEEIDGKEYALIKGLEYTSPEDMDREAGKLFSEKYIREYHGFFDDYYRFQNGKVYKLPVKGTQTAPEIKEEDIRDIVFRNVGRGKGSIQCILKKGSYEIDFVKEGEAWKVNSFRYIADTK